MKVTFHGAAQTVTGSQHLVEVNGKRILLDCGFFQGKRTEIVRAEPQLSIRPAHAGCGGALARPYRPQRESSQPGEERVSRTDLYDAGNRSPRQRHAA